MRGRAAALTMTALLALYLVLVVQYAVILLGTGTWIGVAMGAALIILPFIGGWVLIREIMFVLRAEKLMRRLRDLHELPVDDLPRSPSGRVDAEAADRQFPLYQAAVEAEPESWKAWFLLGLAYDASGDRPRARWATREAIRLERVQRPTSSVTP